MVEVHWNKVSTPGSVLDRSVTTPLRLISGHQDCRLSATLEAVARIVGRRASRESLVRAEISGTIGRNPPGGRDIQVKFGKEKPR